jgi:hypothetical protein
MRRKLCFGFAPLIAALVGLLAADASGGVKDVGKRIGWVRRAGCEGSSKVCPVFQWGSFGGYYYYMGQQCWDSSTVGLASTYKLGICNCSDASCGDKCIDVGFWEAYRAAQAYKDAPSKAGKGKKLGKSQHYHHDYVEAGIADSDMAPLTDDQVIVAGTGYTVAKHLDRVFAKLYTKRDHSQSVNVALHTIKVTPADQDKYDTTIFGAGYQTTQAGTVEIPWRKIKARNGKCCLVRYEGFDYFVVLNRRETDPEE